MMRVSPGGVETGAAGSTTGFDVDAIRARFPILTQEVRGGRLVYLDNAATAQKPERVIAAIDEYYRCHNANVHRGVHTLSQRATELYEASRERLRGFLNARAAREIIFTRGTTEAINLVAQSWGRTNLEPGDEILLTHMEHHSNIVPWQMVAEETGATIKVVAVTDEGELDLDSLDALLSERTKLVGVVHVSNSLGTINPVAELIRRAHEVGALVLVDGAQATSHQSVDVQTLDADFYAISAHKMYGPTGFGALYAKERLLDSMPPWHGGGDMIRTVTFEGSTWADLPAKFEAGTPNMAGAVGTAAAIDFIEEVGFAAISAHETALLRYGTEALLEVPELRLIGTAQHKASVLSFVFDEIHPHDVGTICDMHGVAIRTGHHCTQPLMDRFHVPATSRASLAVYNTTQEVDRLVEALLDCRKIFLT